MTLESLDLERLSERSLTFQAVLISFWLSMCFTIYRSPSLLANIPWVILSYPYPQQSCSLTVCKAYSCLPKGTNHNFYGAFSILKGFCHHLATELNQTKLNYSPLMVNENFTPKHQMIILYFVARGFSMWKHNIMQNKWQGAGRQSVCLTGTSWSSCTVHFLHCEKQSMTALFWATS